MKTIASLKLRKIDPEIWDIVVNGTSDQRAYICSQEPLYFALYYFSDFFEYALADFHYQFFEDFRRMTFGLGIRETQWIGFRESAKTTIAKICLTWAIVYAHKRYISYGSYEKDNAEAALFDVTSWLMTNTRIISDYGYLYRRKKKQGELDDVQTKQKAKFVTTNRVRVIAFSTQESTRGHVFGKYRPDMYVYDDIENNKTKDSHAITDKIIAHLEEARSGLASFGSMLYLCNYIRDDGSVQYIKTALERMDDGVVRDIPVEYPSGRLAWPDKYVKTNKEAAEQNAYIGNLRQQKVSLEKKRQDLGDSVFFTEMMNNPGKSGDYYFNREKVREAINKAQGHPPIKTIGTTQIWEDYIPGSKYSMGADSGEGLGGDSSASGVINHSRMPALLVASFEDNQIGQTSFAGELAKTGRRYGECFIVPEVNKGYGTISKLVEDEETGGYEYPNVYVREVKNKTTKMTQTEFGFHTNTKTKPDMLDEFKQAWEGGFLEIWDIGLLTEMLYYRKADVHRLKREDGTTRHFDKLMAVCLAWVGRKFASASSLSSDDDIYISPQTKEANKRLL
jgi:hypothetical protein